MSKSRKVPLRDNLIYHIYSKSIYGFEMFRSEKEYSRMVKLIEYYKIKDIPVKYSDFESISDKDGFMDEYINRNGELVNINAYCIMPTHIHLVLKQLIDNGISVFINKILNSYSRYFNIKFNRKGPLWESRFKNVIVETDEQFLHLTRYVHLNPVTARLVERPEDWAFSSYNEYIEKIDKENIICSFDPLLNMGVPDYKDFVNSRIDYQRELAHLKSLFLD